MTPVMKEREDTVIRNIQSGNNRCGTLAAAVNNGDDEYFRQCVRPVLTAYEDEAKALGDQRDDALRQANALRHALEYVAQNLRGSVQITEPTIIQAVSNALGRSLF